MKRTVKTTPATGTKVPAKPKQATAAAATSKISQVVAHLERPGGATLAELVAATGWQPHTARAALTGLRKKGYVSNQRRPRRRDGLPDHQGGLTMSLQDRLRELQAMSPAELRQEWERVHRSPAPPTYGPDLLARGVAYRLQERSDGGLPPKIAREIRRSVAQLQSGKPEPSLSPALPMGTRLTREWHGRTHHVEVVQGGFDYQERHHRSLTAIAREITGAGWSGPRFFGLARPEAR